METEHCPQCTIGSVNAEWAVKVERAAKAQETSGRSRQTCAPTICSALQVTPRATSSYTDSGGATASLDSHIEEEGDCPFHQRHSDRVKYGAQICGKGVGSRDLLASLAGQKLVILCHFSSFLKKKTLTHSQMHHV